MDRCLPDRGNTGNTTTNSNTTTPMASHRQDPSKLLTHSEPSVLLRTDPNALLARLDPQSAAENRRTKLAKTGNFYIKGSFKPSDVLSGEWLENYISSHSPRVSPTENSRPKNVAFEVQDPFLVTSPWIPPYAESSEKEEFLASESALRSTRSDSSFVDYLSLAEAPAEPTQLEHTQIEHLSTARSADASHRHPFLDPSAHRWCKVVNELFSTEFEYP